MAPPAVAPSLRENAGLDLLMARYFSSVGCVRGRAGTKENRDDENERVESERRTTARDPVGRVRSTHVRRDVPQQFFGGDERRAVRGTVVGRSQPRERRGERGRRAAAGGSVADGGGRRREGHGRPRRRRRRRGIGGTGRRRSSSDGTIIAGRQLSHDVDHAAVLQLEFARDVAGRLVGDDPAAEDQFQRREGHGRRFGCPASQLGCREDGASVVRVFEGAARLPPRPRRRPAREPVRPRPVPRPSSGPNLL